MAAHSDAVSRPEGVADELSETMVTPSLGVPPLLSQRTSKALTSTCPNVHRGQRRGCVRRHIHGRARTHHGWNSRGQFLRRHVLWARLL
jgi:hypothetical protein